MRVEGKQDRRPNNFDAGLRNRLPKHPHAHAVGRRSNGWIRAHVHCASSGGGDREGHRGIGKGGTRERRLVRLPCRKERSAPRF